MLGIIVFSRRLKMAHVYNTPLFSFPVFFFYMFHLSWFSHSFSTHECAFWSVGYPISSSYNPSHLRCPPISSYHRLSRPPPMMPPSFLCLAPPLWLRFVLLDRASPHDNTTPLDGAAPPCWRPLPCLSFLFTPSMLKFNPHEGAFWDRLISSRDIGS